MLFYLAAVNLIIIYFVAKESKRSRSLTSWAFLLGAIGSILLIIWICVYILCIHKTINVKTTPAEGRADLEPLIGEDEDHLYS